MRPDGKIERIDEFEHATSLKHQGESITLEPRAEASADIYRFFDYITQTLKLHQAYYFPLHANKMYGFFPFAWRLKQGMEVINETVGTTYIIDEVELDQNTGLPTGFVKMSGAPEPSQSHRLLFKRDECIQFFPSFPRTYSVPYHFEDKAGDGQLVQEYSHPWRDTITWLVTRVEPGTVSKQPFQRPRTLRGMPRDTQVWKADTNYGIDTRMRLSDCIVQFDCWTRTNTTAEELVTWFEAYMDTYIRVFLYNGVMQCFFWERLSDELVTRWRNDIVNRTIRYYVRTQSISNRIVSKIRTIAANISMYGSGEMQSISPTGEWPIPTGNHVPISIYEVD